MDELEKKLQLLLGAGNAIRAGLDKSLVLLPIIARQQIEIKAKQKFISSRSEYMSGVRAKYDDFVLIIDMDPENWLANALESGADSFSMKRGLLNGKSSRINKKGLRYAVVPISKDPKRDVDTYGTDMGQEYQRLIQHVMRKPVFEAAFIKNNPKGGIMEVQKLITDEPKLQGFYRTRTYESAQQRFKWKNKPFTHVMFRIVSEAPSQTGATWQHPGLHAANIFKDVEQQIPTIFETLLETNINNELERIIKGG